MKELLLYMAKNLVDDPDSVTVTDIEARKYFDEHPEQFAAQPTVSASQEIRMPKGRPKIKPLAVERKMEGKMLPALMSTSSTKLMTMAHGPKERK